MGFNSSSQESRSYAARRRVQVLGRACWSGCGVKTTVAFPAACVSEFTMTYPASCCASSKLAARLPSFLWIRKPSDHILHVVNLIFIKVYKSYSSTLQKPCTLYSGAGNWEQVEGAHCAGGHRPFLCKADKDRVFFRVLLLDCVAGCVPDHDCPGLIPLQTTADDRFCHLKT